MSQPASRPGPDDRAGRLPRWRRKTARPVAEDPEWVIASSVQLQERPLLGSAGRITARRHPTGWFISAAHPGGLSAEELSDLRHFVCVRVYLLLRNGPIPGAWERGSVTGEWVADLAVVPRLAAPNVAELFR